MIINIFKGFFVVLGAFVIAPIVRVLGAFIMTYLAGVLAIWMITNGVMSVDEALFRDGAERKIIANGGTPIPRNSYEIARVGLKVSHRPTKEYRYHGFDLVTLHNTTDLYVTVKGANCYHYRSVGVSEGYERARVNVIAPGEKITIEVETPPGAGITIDSPPIVKRSCEAYGIKPFHTNWRKGITEPVL